MNEALAMRRRFLKLAPWHVNGTLPAASFRNLEDYVRSRPEAHAELTWYALLQEKIRADAPPVPPEAGLERLLHRIRKSP